MIINTRPIDLAKKTNALLQKANLEFLHIPLTKIKKLTPSSEELSWIESLEEFDSIIFTSQSAVKYGVFYLERKKFIPSIISIGLATQNTLKKSKILFLRLTIFTSFHVHIHILLIIVLITIEVICR